MLSDVIFSGRLQEKFEIDHSWEWKGSEEAAPMLWRLSCALLTFFSSVLNSENEEQTGKLKKELKEEKYTRKRLESKVEHTEEELADLKHEKESLEKVRSFRVVLLFLSNCYVYRLG